MRRIFTSLMLAAAVFAVVPATAAEAQEGQDFRGTFIRDEAASDPMDQIVDDGMSRLSALYRAPIIRNQARKRLLATNEPYAWIQFTPDATSITVETNTYRLTTPRNGMLERWERSRNDFIDVTTVLEANRLEQRFLAEDGVRVNVFTLSPDGNTLNMHVTVTSDKLSSPLEYDMVFRRR